jgi:hypothetical protein
LPVNWKVFVVVTGFRRYEDHVLDRDRVVIDQKGGPPRLDEDR